MGIMANFGQFLSRLFGSKVAYFNKSESMLPSSTEYSDIVGAIADIIGKEVGKLTPQVQRTTADKKIIKSDKLSKLLSLRPNPHMSTYDFLYRMGADLVYNSNAFAICFYNSDYTELQSIEPVSVNSHSIFEQAGNLFFKFVWKYDMKTYIVPYDFVIHIKSRFKNKRFFGSAPDDELKSSLEMLDATYESIKKSLKNSTDLRGYLKFSNMMKDSDIKRKTKEFQDAYFSSENSGGIAGVDSSFDFHELQKDASKIPTEQIVFYRENIYRYYGVNEKILTSNYTEADWNAFYEAVIEPIAIQLSLEFSYKLLSEGERSFGNEIVFTADRLQYATLNTRSAIADKMFEKGIITINEYRNIMYLPEIEGGDERQISLNYVKSSDQSQYQIGSVNSEEKEGDKDEE